MAFRTKQTSTDKLTGYFYEGREIVLTKKQGQSVKKPHHQGAWWPEDKRIEAATLFAVTRNYEKVQDLTGIPARILKEFAMEPWWDHIISQVKQQKNDVLDAKITEALDRALDVINDRLKHGEVYVDRKTLKEYRVPVSSKTAAITTDLLFDKRQLLRGEATSRSESLGQEQRLLQLKEQFERLATSKQINPKSEPIEGELINEPMQGTTEGQTSGPDTEGRRGIQESQTQENGGGFPGGGAVGIEKGKDGGGGQLLVTPHIENAK